MPIFAPDAIILGTKSSHAIAGVQSSSAPIRMCIGDEVKSIDRGSTKQGGYIDKCAANVNSFVIA